MRNITRRQGLALGAGLAAQSVLPARAAITSADVQPPKLDIEKGASLRVLRAAKFVDGDEMVFNANSKRFTEQTGSRSRSITWRGTTCRRKRRWSPILAPGRTS